MSADSANLKNANVFLRLAFDQLGGNKDARKVKGLVESIGVAKDALDSLEKGWAEHGPHEAETDHSPVLRQVETITEHIPGLDNNTARSRDICASLLLPLTLSCQAKSFPSLIITAVDCLGKLFAYNYWLQFVHSEGFVEGIMADTAEGELNRLSGSEAADRENDDAATSHSNSQLLSRVVDMICEAVNGTPLNDQTSEDRIHLQVVKALSSAVLSAPPAESLASNGSFFFDSADNNNVAATLINSAIHGTVLLRAIRTTFNIFLLSKSPSTQIVAQASLTQMIQGIFGRIPLNVAPFGRAVPDYEVPLEFSGSSMDPFLFDQNIKDMFLVLRSLCKLSMKPIPQNEGPTDLKSTAMRSKLLSLHLIHTIACSHMHLFFLNTPVLFIGGSGEPMTSSSESHAVDINTATLFIHAIKPYLCVSITRNAVSVVPQVFDVSMEIFGRIIRHLRVFLKKEVGVIFTEIILPILESKATLISFHQRMALLKILANILSTSSREADSKSFENGGGRLLVEIYLNYDCDPEVTTDRENIWERVVTLLARLVTLHNAKENPQQQQLINNTSTIASSKGVVIRPMTTQALTSFTKEQLRELYSTSGDFADLKKRAVEVLVKGVLAPLVEWGWEKWRIESSEGAAAAEIAKALMTSVDQLADDGENVIGSTLGLVEDGLAARTSTASLNRDDPAQIENLRQRKQNLLEGIKTFNEKPKKGIQFLLNTKLIPSRTPRDIATFLLNTEGLSKTVIGEFLGEGAEENISIMHSFVDMQNFANVQFVSALRNFLQHFRLPGEAQKIDRFMLKFAERYVLQNPGQFSSADTAYVLAYSVIMLNTDQHNAQVKKRMTKSDFLKNNRGIDGDNDLPAAFMEAIFDEIKSNEIILKDEHQASSPSKANVPESVRFEKASANMAMKTEERLKASMLRQSAQQTLQTPLSPTSDIDDAEIFSQPGNSGVFFYATHYDYIKSMFETTWMSVFTALSTFLQEVDDPESVGLALEGFKHSITISCMFGLDLERKAFMSTLGKFAQFNASSGPGSADIKPKAMEAVKVLLEISRVLGGMLGDSWLEIVNCMSNLERLQSNDGRRDSTSALAKKFADEAVAVASSQQMTIMVDKIFTSSVKLSGPAIVGFVKALSAVSWEEITSSESSEHPRMYCLQRLVEISYYNMGRIRLEWSQLWAILGAHFNQVGCYKNSRVSFFALDKLRQLAMKFLELEELPNFKFQRDFLRPFEYVLGNSADIKAKDMALTCLQQMVQGKSKALKSGWKTLFGALIKAAQDENEQIVSLAFELVKLTFYDHFEQVISNSAFSDFVSCLVAFCKNRHEKLSLQSVELLKKSIPSIFKILHSTAGSKLLQSAISQAQTLAAGSFQRTDGAMSANASFASANPPVDETSTTDDLSFRLIFPTLFGFYEITMNCGLEVRARALVYLFDVLKMYALEFSPDSWEVIAKGIIFPIFDDLKLSRQEHRTIDDKEDLTVWLNTTLIQALRLLVDLFSAEFETLRFAVDGLFEILMACMTQENETLARIGSTCLHQFIEDNLDRFDQRLWERTCKTFVNLFALTTPNLLFFDYRVQLPDAPSGGVLAPPEGEEAEALEREAEKYLTSDPEDAGQDLGSESMARHMSSVTSPIQNTNALVFVDGSVDLTGRPRPEKSDFQGIILKCVLHLLAVQTLHEILTVSSDGNTSSKDPDGVYHALSAKNLLVLLGCFERSYRFAEAFNKNTELRLTLFRMGFMKQLPNLLKQEVASVTAYLSVLFKMVSDNAPDRVEYRDYVTGVLTTLCHNVLCNFNTMDPGTKNRNVNSWKPAIILIVNSLANMPDGLFLQELPKLFEEVSNILLQPHLDLDLRIALHSFIVRIGLQYGIIHAKNGPQENGHAE
ncbi:guanine nucleotide exchange protein for ADP-robosylation factor [Entophlyctis sp. JEL0112]|nr:guanine nucleotide exchange protein for ADP-robosylation factor [Entophlyctis sp. JEL0112]